MIEVLKYLEERTDEFEHHMEIARMLEARVDIDIRDEDVRVEIRHVNTIKSGLLIHLYNIVEAVTTRTLIEVGATVVSEKPSRWTEFLLAEWIRSQVWNGEDQLGDKAVKRLTKVGTTLASGGFVDSFTIKGEPGSWNDASIIKVAERLGCKLSLTDKIKRDIFEKSYKDDSTALQHLARKRNAIAHGSSTFEEGANDMALRDLEELSGRIIPFLKAVTLSYQKFLHDKKYLA